MSKNILELQYISKTICQIYTGCISCLNLQIHRRKNLQTIEGQLASLGIVRHGGQRMQQNLRLHGKIGGGDQSTITWTLFMDR